MMESQRPTCENCGAVVPYDPSPNWEYSLQIDSKTKWYYCDENCLKEDMKDKISNAKIKNL